MSCVTLKTRGSHKLFQLLNTGIVVHIFIHKLSPLDHLLSCMYFVLLRFPSVDNTFFWVGFKCVLFSALMEYILLMDIKVCSF